MSFWAFYLPKLSISLLLATPVFLFRRKYWTIYVSALLNIWILAEVIYFKANRIFIDANTLMLLDYLSGFESSIGMYLTPDLLLLLIPLCLTVAAVFLFDNRRCEWRTFAVVLLCGVLLNGVSGKVVNLAWTQEGSTGTSAVHMLLNTAKSVVCKPWDSKAYQMTEIDQADLCRATFKHNHSDIPVGSCLGRESGNMGYSSGCYAQFLSLYPIAPYPLCRSGCEPNQRRYLLRRATDLQYRLAAASVRCSLPTLSE